MYKLVCLFFVSKPIFANQVSVASPLFLSFSSLLLYVQMITSERRPKSVVEMCVCVMRSNVNNIISIIGASAMSITLTTNTWVFFLFFFVFKHYYYYCSQKSLLKEQWSSSFMASLSLSFSLTHFPLIPNYPDDWFFCVCAFLWRKKEKKKLSGSWWDQSQCFLFVFCPHVDNGFGGGWRRRRERAIGHSNVSVFWLNLLSVVSASP